MINPPKETFDELIELFNKNHIETLLHRNEQLIKEYPNSYNIWNLIGVTNLKIKKLNQAEVAFKKASKFKKNDISIFNNLAICFKNQKKYLEAIRYFKKSLSINNTQFRTYLDLGDTYNKIGKQKEAIDCFELAIKIKPNTSDTYNQLGNILLKLKQYNDAIKNYKKSIKLNPTSPDPYNNLANVYKEQSLHQKAIKYYEKVISMRPDLSGPYYNLGTTLAEINQFKDAVKNLKKAIEISPNFVDPYFNLGNILFNKKKYIAALKYFKKAISLNPNFYKAYHVIGSILAESKKYNLALENYKKAISINPDFVSSYNDIANIFLKLGKINNAKAYYKYALSLNNDFLDAFINLFALEVQCSSKSIDDIFLKKNISNKISCNIKFIILKAILYYINGKLDKAEEYLIFYNKNLSATENKSINETDLKFCYGYANLLKKLLKQSIICKNKNNNITKKIYHFGESHCLSFNDNFIKYNKNLYSINSQLTIGAKAFHFGKKNNNSFKAITQSNMSKLPPKSIVFISFGEIDCRYDEGFIKASLKRNISLKSLIKQIVNNYVLWFISINKEKEHTLNFFNIPAPVYNNKLSFIQNKKVAQVINIYNNELKKTLQKYSIMLIDVYIPTLNKNEFSNEKFHCDQRHLDNRIISIIENQLNQ